MKASKKRQADDFHKNINDRYFGPPALICIYMPVIDRSLSLFCIYMPVIDRFSLITGPPPLTGSSPTDGFATGKSTPFGTQGGLNDVSKNEEFCIKNEEFCIKNTGFCIKNEDFCIKNDEICSTRAVGHTQ